MKLRFNAVGGGVLIVSTLLGGPSAVAREPLELVPADSMLCWSGRPLPDTSSADDKPSALQALVEIGTRLTGESLDAGTQFTLRGAELLGWMVRYPHALALIDARARPIDTPASAPTTARAPRVDRLRCVLVVETHGQNEPFLRIIQKVVNEQTDSGAATLQTRRAGRWQYQELRDRRLPAWAVIAWGPLDGYFVITLGVDVWASVAAVAAGEAPSLGQDTWYAAARREHGARALIEIYVSARAIEQRLDPLVDGRVGEFFRAWNVAGLEQAYWALGLQDRALFCAASFRLSHTTLERLYADPEFRDARLMATIPEGARYAIYRLPMDQFFRRFFGSLVTLQRDKPRANLERIWAQVQNDRGFNVERDLLAHLGGFAVLHNDPPHPLHLPLAVTALVEIRDRPDEVRRTLDAICAVFRDAIDKAAAEGRGPPPWTFRQTDDGLWFLQYGPVAGPAWTVKDGFIVVSWSPVALREYLVRAGGAVDARPPL